MNESQIKTAIMKRLSVLPGAFFYRQGASQYSRSGVCDIMGTYFGHTVGLEVKTPEAFSKKNNGCTDNQVRFINQVCGAGGYASVVCSVEGAVNFLAQVAGDLELRYGQSFQ